MAKKKIELNDAVQALVDRYLEMNDDKLDLNELTNKALKFYIVNHLSSQEVKQILKQKDVETSKYVDDLLRSSYNDFGGF